MQSTQRLALAFLLLAPACSKSEGEAAAPMLGEAKLREAPRVRVSPVLRKEMVRTLSTTNAIESEYEVSILPRVSGVVLELHAEEGDRVTEGQLLAVIDAREAEAGLADARAALQEAHDLAPLRALAVKEASEAIERAKLTHEQAVRDVERNETAGLISKNELEKLRTTRDQAYRDLQSALLAQEKALAEEAGHEATVQRAELAVTKQELTVSFTRITSPFPGVIANRNIRVGDTASTAEAAFVITDPDRLKVVIYRPQKELPFFKSAANAAGGEEAGAGVTITAYPDAIPGHEYAGKIRFVSPTIDASSGSFRVTIDLEQPPEGDAKPRLLPGMLVRLGIVTERHPDALVVEKRALRREGDRFFLFAVRDGRAVRVDVAEDLSSDEEVEVLPRDGALLEPGELVVVVGNRDLEDGQEVKVQAEPGAAPPATVERDEAIEATAQDADSGAEPGTEQAATPEAADAPDPTAHDGQEVESEVDPGAAQTATPKAADTPEPTAKDAQAAQDGEQG